MTQKQLTEQNNKILRCLVDYTAMKQAFENAFAQYQSDVQKIQEYNYRRSTVEQKPIPPIPQAIHDLFNRVGECEMNMLEAADLLDKYTAFSMPPA